MPPQSTPHYATDNGEKSQNEPGNQQESTTQETTSLQKKVEQREILLSWSAPDRHFVELNRRTYFMILACVVAFSLILVLVGQYYLMAAIGAVMFLVYVLGTVPPGNVTHTITNKGVETAGEKYEWSNLVDFWYSKRDDQMFLNVGTDLRFPGRLLMLVGEKDVKKVYDVLQDHLIYRDIRKQSRLGGIIDGEWVDPANL